MRYWHSTQVENDITELSLSLEEQTFTQNQLLYTDQTNVAVLQRYPTIVSRLRYGGANGFNSIQIAGLISPIGFDSLNPVNSFHEAFDTGWGISTNASF